MSAMTKQGVLAGALRLEMLRLARDEEEQAAVEAAAVPYWAFHPPSVQGHRAAAAALRARADDLLRDISA